MHDGLRTEIRSVYGVWDRACVTVATEVPEAGRCVWFGDGGASDDTATFVATVQIYLRNLRCKRPVPTEAMQAWTSFYERYDCAFRQLVGATCLCRRAGMEGDDLLQEVWMAISSMLCLLEYDPDGSLDALLRIVAKCVIGRAIWQSRRPPPMQTIDESVPSPAPDPAAACCAAETLNRVYAALRERHDETSELNYELFLRRFVDGECICDCAEALGLTPRAVHCRCDRTKRRLRKLLADSDERGAEEDRDLAPPPRRPVRKKPK
jgi:DNA-directed RNA polymerase specialized sigma24 family protein